MHLLCSAPIHCMLTFPMHECSDDEAHLGDAVGDVGFDCFADGYFEEAVTPLDLYVQNSGGKPRGVPTAEHPD